MAQGFFVRPVTHNSVSSSPAEGVARQAATAVAQTLVPSGVRARLRGLLYGLLFTVIASAILVAPSPLARQVTLKVGDVSPADMRAPRQISYISDVLTKRAREKAAAAVKEVYDPPQMRISRQQVTQAHALLDSISAIRADSNRSDEDKLAALMTVPGYQMTPALAQRLIALPESSWQLVSDEVVIVLNRAMGREIRETDLPEVQRLLPTLLGPQMNDAEAEVVLTLVSQLVRPNSFINLEQTEAERQAARDHTQPVEAKYEVGEIILRAGNIVDAADLEALDKLGLLRTDVNWQSMLGTVLLVVLLTVMLGLYLWRFNTTFWLGRRQAPMLCVLLLCYVALVKLVVPAHTLLPYILPTAALAMLLTTLLDLRLGMLVSIVIAVLVGYLGNSVELMVYSGVAALIAPLTLGRGDRISSFIGAGVYVALANVAVILVFRLPNSPVDTTGLIQLLATAALNGGLAVSMTLIGFSLLGTLFSATTPLQLIELARPTHPLQRQLLLKAPGTYHHTLLLSNMAERAAEAIGCDVFLTRVGAYYHDIGKIVRPYFFVENFTDNSNPHDHLTPEASARLIIAHVTDGIELARRYRLPERIQDFILEHHGTSRCAFFYCQAVERAGSAGMVDEKTFRYPGPKPRSKETAIVMLADSCEAAARANRTNNSEQLAELIRKLIYKKVQEGELDQSDLTLADLEQIHKAFMTVLQGLHHPRINYPEQVPGTLSAGAVRV